jgi:hypothetical protein
LFKGEVEVQLFLRSQPGLVAAVHVFHLLEIVPNIGPKFVICVVGYLRLHEGELLAEEGSYVSRGISFPLEVEPRKVDKGWVYLRVCGIALEEARGSVLF